MGETTALIGYTGFVGGTLARSLRPDAVFRSADIGMIRGGSFGHVVCAGVQAKKWWANQNPEEDWAGIESLLDALQEVRAERFTLVSTIDVYPEPRGVDEGSEVDWENNHAYGRHRRRVEQWVQERFDRVLVMRLPGLFGPGLKKNVIFDMQRDNELHKVHPGGVFQYYDTRRVAGDMEKAWDAGIGVLNVSSEPIGTAAIRDRFFAGKRLAGEVDGTDAGPPPAGYDMRSVHAGVWGGTHGYLYSADRVLDDLGDWLASEKEIAGR